MEIFLQLIGAITPIILAYMGYSFKGKFKKMELNSNAQSKEQKKDSGALLQRMDSFEIKLEKIDKSLNEFKEDNEFRIEFRNAIRIKTQSTIQLIGSVLKGKTANLLLYWADKIEHFGLDFYYSKKRQEREQELANYLTTILDTRIADFYDEANDICPKIKTFKGQKISFSQFMEQLIIHKYTYILKEKLIKNGLSQKDVIDVFSNYIEDFFKELVTAIQIWEQLS